ncbi:DUF819 family protein [Staphylococcus hominis subsp. novobiosepticus]|uniref:hypothetical protein n=1 Tax=Staphylococcus hominis TaxID=1290 RepID=UPI00324A687E
MLHEPLISATILFALLALGEIISTLTKARVPMLLTAMISFLLLKWAGILPNSILKTAILPSLGAIAIAPVIMHMGTMMPLSTLKKQWKAVIISLFGILGSTTLILVVVSLVFDFRTAASGVGPIAGGLVALLITIDKLKQLNLNYLIVLPALIQGLQSVVGLPLSSFFMKRYGKYYISTGSQSEYSKNSSIKEKEHTNSLHKKYPILKNDVLRLFIMFTLASLAFIIGNYTHIHYSIISLAFGVIGLKIGLFEQAEAEKNKSFTILVVAIMLIVIGSMGAITPKDLWHHLPAIILILLMGAIGILIGGSIAAKLIGWKYSKALPVALTALYGFPGDYLLCEEVSRSVSTNDEEKEALFKELLSPMLIGGFTTVTVASVVLTGIIMNFI